jgi:hypothetical protein
MNCIVLAFSTLQDLPNNWSSFERIDCFGEVALKETEINANRQKIIIHNEFFAIGKNSLPDTPYQECFIRHPDPWGEPRNWIQAIAGLGECLKGKLIGEFWYPHEIIAFHFLLVSLLNKDQVNFIHAEQLADSNNWDNFGASWQINAISLQSAMLDQYQREKQTILQNFYTSIGKFYREITVDEAITLINQIN